MNCSVNHSNLATKFCPVCGSPSVAAASSANFAPPQSFAPQQWPKQAAPNQWQQHPAPSEWTQQPLQGTFPAPLASRGKRLGGLLLDYLFFTLSAFMLLLPYLIWLLIVMKDGQTPGKQVLSMRVYATTTNRPATWGHMAIRTILIPWMVIFVYLPYWFSVINYGYLSYALTNPFAYAGGLYAFGSLLLIGIRVFDLVLFFSSPLNQRISDRWAKTVVLDETPTWKRTY